MPSGAVRVALGSRRDPCSAKKSRVVVDHLELEARGLADDVLDLVERLLVLAGDLDDDVLVARRDARLAEAELVDALVDGVLGLADGLVADVGLDLLCGS